MPHRGEHAPSSGHSSMVTDMRVSSFLEDCAHATPPDDRLGKALAVTYETDRPASDGRLPVRTICIDGSRSVAPIEGALPSTQIGFVRVAAARTERDLLERLAASGRLVDPFLGARLQQNHAEWSWPLPGSNVLYKKSKTVRDGFRLAVHEAMCRPVLEQVGGDSATTLSDLVLRLSRGQALPRRCPECGEDPDPDHDHPGFDSGAATTACGACGATLYPSDMLRIHEGVSDYGDCTTAVTRFMHIVEHLLMAALVAWHARSEPAAIGDMAFVIDGPLAVFGQSVQLGDSLMRFYRRLFDRLAEDGHRAPVMMGVQKEGALMDHARALERYLPAGGWRLIDDDYRDRLVAPIGPMVFGRGAYYGQDLIYKPAAGRIHGLCLLFPFPDRSGNFDSGRCDPNAYGEMIGRALDLVDGFRLDLYPNALIPSALAHRAASIAAGPGGRALRRMTDRIGRDRRV